MNASVLSQNHLSDFLLNVAVARPVFILSSVRTKRKGISISKTMSNEYQGEQADVRVLASANNWIEVRR
ncbi:MAG: hypothetical protein ACKV22_36590 [Bryobacteraceae bacterium]